MDIPCDDQWYKDLMALLWRTTDLGVRHVAYQLTLPFPEEDLEVQDATDTVWKPRRSPAYARSLSEVGKPVRNSAGSCHVCTDDFTTAKSTALKLRCCGQIVCTTCIIVWSCWKIPREADCPLCRARFFDFEVADSLACGTVEEVYYRNTPGNEPFNECETFERTLPTWTTPLQKTVGIGMWLIASLFCGCGRF